MGQWYDEMGKEGTEPDGLAVVFMSHMLGRNITLISGKGEEWSTQDMAVDILLVYKGESAFAPTDVGT